MFGCPPNRVNFMIGVEPSPDEIKDKDNREAIANHRDSRHSHDAEPDSGIEAKRRKHERY
jgi:hypothetical protein